MTLADERPWDFLRTSSWLLCLLTELALAWVFFCFYEAKNFLLSLNTSLPPLSSGVAHTPLLVIAAVALVLAAGLVLKEVLLVNSTVTIIINVIMFLLVVFLYMIVQEARTQPLGQVLQQIKPIR